MKKLVFLLVLIAIGWAATPFGIGLVVEGHYDELLAYYKKELAPYKVERISYERGYLSSTATYKFVAPSSHPNVPDVELTLVDHIKHMPNFGTMSMATVESEIQLPAEVQGEIDKVLGGRKLVEFTGQIGFDLTTTTHINSEPFEVNEDGVNFKWLGMTGSGILSSDFKNQEFDLKFAGFSFTMGDKSFGLSDVNADVSVFKGSKDLTFGDGVISFGTIEIHEPSVIAPMDLVISNLMLQFAANEHDDAGDYEISYSIDGFEANGAKGENIALNIALRNFDNKMMADLNDAAEAMSTDPQAAQMLGLKLLGNLKGFIAQRPQFEISKLYAELPMGNIEGHFMLGVVGDWNPSILMGNTAALMNLFKAELGFTAPESLVQDLAISQALEKEQMIAAFSGEEIDEQTLYARAEAAASQSLFNMTNMGFLKYQDGVYSTDIIYDAGTLEVNGQDMSGVLSQLPM